MDGNSGILYAKNIIILWVLTIFTYERQFATRSAKRINERFSFYHKQFHRKLFM